jgi:hypothetical protein
LRLRLRNTGSSSCLSKNEPAIKSRELFFKEKLHQWAPAQCFGAAHKEQPKMEQHEAEEHETDQHKLEQHEVEKHETEQQ